MPLGDGRFDLIVDLPDRGGAFCLERRLAEVKVLLATAPLGDERVDVLLLRRKVPIDGALDDLGAGVGVVAQRAAEDAERRQHAQRRAVVLALARPEVLRVLERLALGFQLGLDPKRVLLELPCRRVLARKELGFLACLPGLQPTRLLLGDGALLQHRALALGRCALCSLVLRERRRVHVPALRDAPLGRPPPGDPHRRGGALVLKLAQLSALEGVAIAIGGVVALLFAGAMRTAAIRRITQDDELGEVSA